MRATVLSDNIASGELPGEHGLSIYIEYGDGRYLLDVGASGLFLENAGKLGVDISAVDAASLSHAHYDHSNGMETFFKANDKARFFLRDGAAEDCWSRHPTFKYIGLPRGILKDYRERIVFASGKYRLAEGVWLLPHSTPGLERIGEANRMYRRRGLRCKPDDFAHEQSLIFETDNGLVVFNSCCHAGADVVISEAAAAFPGTGVYALIGGFHLVHSPEERVRELAARLRETGVREIYTGHCTGGVACEILHDELGESVRQLHVGTVMSF